MGFHPENPHRGPYPFEQLAHTCPELKERLYPKPHGSGWMLDFSDPTSVFHLNRSLLRHYYGIANWNIPPGYLCPTIPGRTDYLYHIRDLLGCSAHENKNILDIGTGASGVYALIAAALFGWNVIASDIDSVSLTNLEQILISNPNPASRITLLLQSDPNHMLRGILSEDAQIDATICNPPFYNSAETSERAHLKKHLTHVKRSLPSDPEIRTLQGVSNELHCMGGELAFIRRLLTESLEFQSQVNWFTILVSKASTLRLIHPELKKTAPTDIRIIPMKHGNKTTRILAWSYR